MPTSLCQSTAADPNVIVERLVRNATSAASSFNVVGAARAIGASVAALRAYLNDVKFLALVEALDTRTAQLVADCRERMRQRDAANGRSRKPIEQTANYVRAALRNGWPLPEDANYDAAMALEATDALPGSPEKVAVMAARAANFEALFHPADARISLVGTPGGGAGEVARRNNAKPRGERLAG